MNQRFRRRTQPIYISDALLSSLTHHCDNSHNSVISTKAMDRLRRSIAAWRDLLFLGQRDRRRAVKKAGPSTALIRARRSRINSVRDDRLGELDP